MPLTVTGRKQDVSALREFAWTDMSGLLDIKSVPQQVADNALTVATNVYGRTDGAVEMRKGLSLYGTVLRNGAATKGLFRFCQQVINGIAQTSPVNMTLAEVAGGHLYNGDTDKQLGIDAILGAQAAPWTAVQIYDPDHLQSTGPVPILTKVSGGTLAAGTYQYEETVTNGAGQTLVSYSASITITASDVTNGIRSIKVDWTGQGVQPLAVPGATGYKVYRNSGAGFKLMSDGTIGSGSTTTYTDTGAGTETVTTPPVSNTGGVAPSDVAVLCTGSGGPYLWDGYTISTPSDWTANAPSAKYCQVVNNILFFGGISIQPNLLVGMKVGHPETFALVNEDAISLPIAGLGVVGAGAQAYLIVGMSRGIAVISQYGLIVSENDLPMSDGVDGYRTMISVDGYCYFVGSFGIYVTDGVNVQRISDKVEPWILNDPLYPDFPMNGDRTQSWALYFNNRIYFFYLSNTHFQTALVWDVRLQGWTVYNIASGGPELIAGVVLDAPGDTVPHTAVVGGYLTSQLYNFDVYNGTGHNVDDAGTTIQTSVLSKYFKVGLAGHDKQLQRCDFEFFLDSTGGFGGVAVAQTDYGASSSAQVVTPAPAGAQFDSAIFDVSTFASGTRNYVKQRMDTMLRFEAVAFGCQTQDTNPPYVFAATSGVYLEEPRA